MDNLKEKLIAASSAEWKPVEHLKEAAEEADPKEVSYAVANYEKYQVLGDVGEIEPAVNGGDGFNPTLLGYRAYFLGDEIKGDPITRTKNIRKTYGDKGHVKTVTEPVIEENIGEVFFESKHAAKAAVEEKLRELMKRKNLEEMTHEYNFHKVPISDMGEFLEEEMNGVVESKERTDDGYYEIIERV